ncbi:hypothetical protein [uncultured Microbacterium sp.]|uniref:hypothetical protein n=1 Tax=uncultured Microbacterium sp. TaxID=191216 RepID=UPI0025CD7D85|nr:hypothetical protein [uncultured Microbacterium sp.]
MIGMIVVEHRSPRRRWWKRRPKPTLRGVARAVAYLQVAEGMALHGERDGCLQHALQAQVYRSAAGGLIPSRLLRDSDWRYRHIEAPGVRIQARAEDRWADA